MHTNNFEIVTFTIKILQQNKKKNFAETMFLKNITIFKVNYLYIGICYAV